MHLPVAVFLSLAAGPASSGQRAADSASFVTLLGRDTVALESYRRAGSRIDGDIVLRVPGTVRFHYVLELRTDGTASRSVVDVTPLTMDAIPRSRVMITFLGDSARVDIDSSGTRQRTMWATRRGTVPILTSGFGSSFGLYASLGMYEPLLASLRGQTVDSVSIPIIDAVSGRTGTRQIVRRSPTLADIDYFRIAWTHITFGDGGRIERVDMSETTEKTQSRRAGLINVDSAAKEFARRDRAGKGLGIASPSDSARGRIGAVSIAIQYSSPRKRGREILGTTVPYDRVWRTGANAATLLTIDRDLAIGQQTLRAGTYSVWTIPRRDGAELILNAQHGQWGTEYDASRDVLRLPMTLSRLPTPLENFSIAVSSSTRAGEGELRIQWDDFAWSVPVRVK